MRTAEQLAARAENAQLRRDVLDLASTQNQRAVQVAEDRALTAESSAKKAGQAQRRSQKELKNVTGVVSAVPPPLVACLHSCLTNFRLPVLTSKQPPVPPWGRLDPSPLLPFRLTTGQPQLVWGVLVNSGLRVWPPPLAESNPAEPPSPSPPLAVVPLPGGVTPAARCTG